MDEDVLTEDRVREVKHLPQRSEIFATCRTNKNYVKAIENMDFHHMHIHCKRSTTKYTVLEVYIFGALQSIKVSLCRCIYTHSLVP